MACRVSDKTKNMSLFRRRGTPRLYDNHFEINKKLNKHKNTHKMPIEKFQNQYRIPSARATWHDYDGGIYFLSFARLKIKKIYYYQSACYRIFFTKMGVPRKKKRNFAICLYAESPIKQAQSVSRS